jgi:pimeloyl-ACP methyl ester carboxylesterase
VVTAQTSLRGFIQSAPTRVFVILLACLAVASSGCVALPLHRKWPQPALTNPDQCIVGSQVAIRFTSLELTKAEIAYATACEAMTKGDACCVDEFFQAAQFSWRDLETHVCQRVRFSNRAIGIYRSSLNALITQGQRFKRLDPSAGLRIQSPHGWCTIPISYHGFPWSPEDFDELLAVGEYSTKELTKSNRQDGLGIPTIVVRRKEASGSFLREQLQFAATLVLKPQVHPDSKTGSSFGLELHDPLRTTSVEIGGVNLPLAHDSTAPIAHVLNTTERNYISAFLQPGLATPDEEGLFMLEPYQAGKIPIVFVHGLLSDRITWANMVNEFYSHPELVERFQIWGFQYATGEPFLRSASVLRRQLQELRTEMDPDATDSVLEQVVLVGHSMGGLISKILVAESGDQLWDSLSNRQFADVLMEPESREKLAEVVFFKPSPLVSRVVFIGTPHRGSALAQRAIGRVGALLVKEKREAKEQHDRLIRDNPGTFSREFARRVPSSIDLLDPDSPLLQAIESLPIESRVRIHSIIGYGRWMFGNGDSDGVVPVTSAWHFGSSSQKFVDEKHSKLPQDSAVIDEVFSILHAVDCQSGTASLD